MALVTSSILTEDEIDELVENTVFDEREIEALYERFKYLDRAGCGYLTFAEFQLIPEFDGNPFAPLILAHLERCSEYRHLNFACFLDFLAHFSEHTEKSVRIAFFFELFDLGKNGRLSRQVLGEIHVLLCGEADDRAVARVLQLYDRNRKGYLSRGDFARLYNDDASLEKNSIIDFSREFRSDPALTFWDLIWPTNRD